MDWGGLNLFARAFTGFSFAKVAIVLSHAGVRFVDFVVGRECLVGDDVGEFGRELPPCRLRPLLFLRKGRGHVVTRAVARMSCVLPMRLLVLLIVLDVRSMMGDGCCAYVGLVPLACAWRAFVPQISTRLLTFPINARSRILAA